MKSRAVFLDRDGTIIEDRGYISDPDQVELFPGAAEAIRRLSEADYRVVVVSNQSGVARGLFDEDALAGVHGRLEELLSEHGAALDEAYYCPYFDGPEATVEKYRRDSELRKPRPGMLIQAARELNIDLDGSWMIGDLPTDVEAGRRAGCRTVLLDGAEGRDSSEASRATHAARDLAEAADILLSESEPDYEPPAEPAPTSGDDEVMRALENIHEQLDRAQRTKRQDDFSFLRFFSALLQMFAIVAAVWGVIALLDDQAGAATARLMLACFLQLAAISAFAVDRFH